MRFKVSLFLMQKRADQTATVVGRFKASMTLEGGLPGLPLVTVTNGASMCLRVCRIFVARKYIIYMVMLFATPVS